jgi:hypothetical protein
MTLSDVGFYFRDFAWLVALLIAVWALAPVIAEGWRERKRQREKEEMDSYLDRIDPDYERFVHGNGTKVPLRDIEQNDSIDPWKRY